jgi:hypothetical protein
MKNIFTLIFFLSLSLVVGAAPYHPAADHIRLQLETSEPKTAVLNQGPFQTKSVGHSGLNLTYQDGPVGPNWAQLTGSGATISDGSVKLSVAPTALLGADGRTGYGASVHLQLSRVLEVNHTSHLGGLQRHITAAVLAPDSALSVQMLRVAGKDGVTTRVGPSLKLGKKARIWYGMATDGSPNLLLMTGNVRF